MSYKSALEAAGANVLAFETFGSYSGDWFAKVEYENRTFWVHGSYGSCSYCDAFQSEFDYSESGTCETHRYEKPEPNCNDCKTASEDYNKRLATFGRSYLESGDMLQTEAEQYASEKAEYSSGDDEALAFIKANAII